MEWVEALGGTIVGLDTAPLIYLIEEHPIFLPYVLPFLEALDRGKFSVVTSVLTLTERHNGFDFRNHSRRGGPIARAMACERRMQSNLRRPSIPELLPFSRMMSVFLAWLR